MGAVHRSLGINLTAEENPGKTQLSNLLMMAMQPVIASNGNRYLQMTSAGCTACQAEREREMEGMKGKDGEDFLNICA